MWSKDDAIMGPQRAIFGKWLIFEHIQAGARQSSAAEGPKQRRRIHDAASRRIYES